MLALKDKISEKPWLCYLESENSCEKEHGNWFGLERGWLAHNFSAKRHILNIKTAFPSGEHPRKLLQQAHVQCTINLTIVIKLSLGTEHLLAKNMLPLGNEHNIRFSISYKNSRKKGRERFWFLNLCFSMFYCVFNGKSLRWVTIVNGEDHRWVKC